MQWTMTAEMRLYTMKKSLRRSKRKNPRMTISPPSGVPNNGVNSVFYFLPNGACGEVPAYRCNCNFHLECASFMGFAIETWPRTEMSWADLMEASFKKPLKVLRSILKFFCLAKGSYGVFCESFSLRQSKQQNRVCWEATPLVINPQGLENLIGLSALRCCFPCRHLNTFGNMMPRWPRIR